MKRIKAACICQTLCFRPKDGLPRQTAAELVEEEVRLYQASLDRSGTRYRILDKAAQPDGSIELKIIKQYNQSPVGDYLA